MSQPYPLPRQTRETQILNGDGGTTYGPFAFQIFDVEDVVVLVQPEDADAFEQTDAVTVSKTSDDALSHFTITFDQALSDTTQYIVRAARVHERSVGVNRGTSISLDALEREFSKMATVLQELRRDSEQALRLPAGFGLPVVAVPRDGRVATWDLSDVSAPRLRPGPSEAEIEDAGAFAGQAQQSLADLINLLEASVPSTTIPHTTLEIPEKNIPGLTDSIETSGFSAAGDGGATRLKSIAPPPVVKPWHHQSSNDRWWTFGLQTINSNMCGTSAGASAATNVQALRDAIEYVASINGTLEIIDALPLNDDINLPSGRFDVSFRGGELIFAAGVELGLTIGTPGASVYRGMIDRARVRKETYEGGDAGIVIINVAEMQLRDPMSINFSKGYAVVPTSGCRVAWSTIINPLSQGHQYGMYWKPVTGYANENTIVGGRMAALNAGRLIDHILLDNTEGTGAGHNRFLGVSAEGWAGGGSCGAAAVRCIGAADSNLFHYCRGEKYNSGWDNGTYVFDSTAQNNTVIDNRIDNDIVDPLNRNNVITPNSGIRVRDVQGVATHPSFHGIRNTPITDDTKKFALDLEDTYTPSGKVGAIRYRSPRNESRAGRLVHLETGFGEVFIMDDAGTILPRDNFADLGASNRRWRNIFANLPIYADNAAAVAGGVAVDQLYQTAAGEVRIRV
jgi:hypothetical protein